jgi:hypothetical protein
MNSDLYKKLKNSSVQGSGTTEHIELNTDYAVDK